MQEQYVFGFHVVQALLECAPKRVLELSLLDSRSDQRLQALEALAVNNRVLVRRLDKSTINDLVDGNHQGVIARCQPLAARGEQELPELLASLDHPALLLVLDGVTDPHNLGACMRSAEAAGVDAVIVPKDKSADLTPVTRKVACGATELLPFFKVTNLARCLRKLQQEGVWIVGLAGDSGQQIYDIDLTGSIAIVMGAEGAGLRKLSRDNCDFLAGIPMPGRMESLNVSVAAGVCLFEAVRQRALNGGSGSSAG